MEIYIGVNVDAESSLSGSESRLLPSEIDTHYCDEKQVEVHSEIRVGMRIIRLYLFFLVLKDFSFLNL